mgnify:CR=1 FL=1
MELEKLQVEIYTTPTYKHTHVFAHIDEGVLLAAYKDRAGQFINSEWFSAGNDLTNEVTESLIIEVVDVKDFTYDETENSQGFFDFTNIKIKQGE